jgi:hypothetical protein
MKADKQNSMKVDKQNGTKADKQRRGGYTLFVLVAGSMTAGASAG